MLQPVRIALVATFVLSTAASRASAEGTAQLGTYQALRAGAVLNVDILEPATESIRWIGRGAVTITDPDGVALGTLSSGATLSLVGRPAGAYRLVLGTAQLPGDTWDVTVVGQGASGGRLWSTNWIFDAGSYAATAGNNGSFYAVVNGGAGTHRPVIELALRGLAGYVYDVNANRVGVDGALRGRSVPVSGNSVTPEFPIYLQPPTLATYTRDEAAVFGLSAVGGASTGVDGQPLSPCSMLAPGQSEISFLFTATTAGTYQLRCDLDGDGLAAGDSDDLLIIGVLQPGLNVATWDGVMAGAPVAPGTYPCAVTATIGEFHYVGKDIETSYPGMRMYEVNADGSRRPLAMYWDDSLVQASAIAMPNGQLGLVNPGSAGLLSGAYGATPVPDVDARAWGNFVATGKGNNTFLDTYVWLDASTSGTVTIEAVDTSIDSDGDQVSDFAERCQLGTDPNNPDSDGDGTPDGEQYLSGTSLAQNGGLESNGRLASALAERAIQRGRGVVARKLGPSPLADWVAGVELDRLTAQPSTPDDLPAITNALDVHGVDWLDASGRARASALIIRTSGELYEHSKEICDRAHGAELDRVLAVPLAGQLAVGARFVRPRDGLVDHALSFKLYAVDGGHATRAAWMPETLAPPRPGQEVLNVQVWADRSETLDALVAALLTRWRLDARLIDEVATLPEGAAGPAVARLPPAVIRAGTLLGESLQLDVAVRSTERPTWARLVGVDERGASAVLELGPIGVGPRVTLARTLPLFADATVELVSADGAVDRVWLSDGAWARFDDGLWGGATRPEAELGCPPWRLEGIDASLRLAGCARTSAPVVDSTLGVARHLARPLALDAGAALIAHVDALRAGEVCLEAPSIARRSCRPMSAGVGWQAWPLEDFDPAVVAAVELLAFASGPGAAQRLEIAGVALARGPLPVEVRVVKDPEPPTASGCHAGSTTPRAAAPLALALIALGRRRRRR